MGTYAVVEDAKVTNVIVAESREIAEDVTGRACVEYTEADPAGIGWDYDGEMFISPRPFASWTFDRATKTWNAPVPMPEGGLYTWNESTGSWDEVAPTEE